MDINHNNFLSPLSKYENSFKSTFSNKNSDELNAGNIPASKDIKPKPVFHMRQTVETVGHCLTVKFTANCKVHQPDTTGI